MNYTLTKTFKDGSKASSALAEADLPRLLLEVAGGGNTARETAQAMQWSHLLAEAGVVKAKRPSTGTVFEIRRNYEFLIPDYCTVHGDDGAMREAMAKEPALLDACIVRMKSYAHLLSADLHLSARVPQDAEPYKHPGWCEYLMVLTFGEANNPQKLTVGVIQRQPGAKIEFHS